MNFCILFALALSIANWFLLENVRKAHLVNIAMWKDHYKNWHDVDVEKL